MRPIVDPKRRPIQLMLLVLFAILSTTDGSAATSRDLRTDVPLHAVPLFEAFTIRADAPAGEMADIILRLFAENKTLRKLSCDKNESETLRPICSLRRGDDLFMAYFNSRDYTLVLSLDPQNYELWYKPDYKYFYRLRDELRQALEATFGKDKVIQGAERKATGHDDESRKYFKEMFSAPERLMPENESGKASQ